MSKPGYARQLTDLPKPYHTAVMAEVAQQTDRGAAIVGAAYVDLMLREAITARMSDPPDATRRLFEERGRLHAFGARIHQALALGICGESAHTDLGIIKDVRNAFAHSAEAMDFSHSYVAKRCNDLWFAKIIHYGKRPVPSTAKESFVRTIELLTDGLHENIRRQKAGIPLSTFLMIGPRLTAKGGPSCKS